MASFPKEIPGDHSFNDGMTLYVKAGPCGKICGDCPFTHYARMVFAEKKMSNYELQPCTQETKPKWLLEHYEGKMPALRHGNDCIVESSVIADYINDNFLDPVPRLPSTLGEDNDPTVGFFPAIARYLKNTEEGKEEQERLEKLRDTLQKLNQHLEGKMMGADDKKMSCFLNGSYDQMTLKDCSLIPQLYVCKVGIQEFKNNIPNISNDFTAVQKYMDTMFARSSFKETVYPPEVLVWGWSQARSK